jgi:hypothetical protein
MTTKLQAPTGTTAVSFAGTQFDADANGIVTIDGTEEARAVAFLRTQCGFTDPVPAKSKKGGSPTQAEVLQKLEADVAADVAAAQTAQ